MIDRENWVSMSTDVKGEIYEGLLQKNAEDVKSGAGQYFTPRPLIRAMVECIRPEPRKTIADPCCGSGGFLLAAQSYLADSKHYTLDREAKEFLKRDTFRGWEIVPATFKLSLMNLFLHNIGDLYGEVPITLGDALLTDPGERFDYVLRQSQPEHISVKSRSILFGYSIHIISTSMSKRRLPHLTEVWHITSGNLWNSPLRSKSIIEET